MRFRLALEVSALAAAAMVGAPVANAASGNLYYDGGDFAVAPVAAAAPIAGQPLFRLNAARLEPGCQTAAAAAGHIDVRGVIGGDQVQSLHVAVLDAQTLSIDQVLVAGPHTGYTVINNFDTGTSTADPDIDPGQVAVNIDNTQTWTDPTDGKVKPDDATVGSLIVCYSDHEDSGQNEPYIAAGRPGEVAAVNRPILRPQVTTFGEAFAVGNSRGAAVIGLGYTVEKWYSLATVNDVPPYTNRLTDPNALATGNLLDRLFMDNGVQKIELNPSGQVQIAPRIEGPRFNLGTDTSPLGVLRVNDVDKSGEDFLTGNVEPSNFGQTSTFGMSGDTTTYLNLNFQGDLPLKWSVKPSLAVPASLRSVSFTPADFDAWDQGWQNYYCGKGPHPTMPLSPGTRSPEPRSCPVTVNAPEVRPTFAPQITVAVPAAPVAAPVKPAAAVKKAATAKQKAAYRKCIKKANKKHGKVRTKARAKCAKLPH